ncbi:MAG: helix-turn-helix domain-containing protein [Alphaproteobacteria bacterium]|nr:helix-turn-helix domain-containing protein [Alphaproteobacteria bacterium]
MGRIMTLAIGDKIAQMRESGLGCALIAKEFGISKGSVDWYCLTNGIDPPKPRTLKPVPSSAIAYERGAGKVRRFTSIEDEYLLVLEQQGLSYTKIARQLGRPRSSVIGRLATLARHDARMGL